MLSVHKLQMRFLKCYSISGPINVENVGKISMENITITILSTFKSGTVSVCICKTETGTHSMYSMHLYFHSCFLSVHSKVVKLVQDHVLSSLPLQPGTNTHFDLGFYGLHDACHGDSNFESTGKIKITYGGGEAWKQGMSRQAAIDFKINVLCSLRCSYYTVEPLDQG